MSPIRLGSLSYINTLPVTHCLEEEQPGDIEVIPGEPRHLNALLAHGMVDVAPISSIEYACHQRQYLILPDLGISSRGPVGSVLLFSRHPLEGLNQQTVGVCDATATSAALLRVLLEDFWRVTPVLQQHARTSAYDAGEMAAILLIGDEALRYRNRPVARRFSEHVFDLGSLWWDTTGLPMVFAIWAARRVDTVVQQQSLGNLSRALIRARERGTLLPPSLLGRASGQTGLDQAALRAYYGGLHYGMEEDLQRGLLAFYERASRKGLCPPCSNLRFLCAGVPMTRQACLPSRPVNEEGS